MAFRARGIKGKLIYTDTQDIYLLDFSSLRTTKVYSLVKEERENLGGISGVCWSPDGKNIVFSKRKRTPDFDTLYIITECGEEVKKIERENLSILCPFWSPDEKKIAFIVQEQGLQGIYLIDLADLKIQQICNMRPWDIQPSWSPDSKAIAFTVEREKKIDTWSVYSGEIFLIDADGQNLRKLTTGLSPLWQSNNKIIYLGKDGFYSVNIDGTNNTKIISLPKFAGGVDSVALSSDRNYLIYHTYTPDLGPLPQDGFHVVSLKDLRKKMKFGLFSGQVHSMSWTQ